MPVAHTPTPTRAGKGGERGVARPEVLQELLGSCERVVQEIDSVSTVHPDGNGGRGVAQETVVCMHRAVPCRFRPCGLPTALHGKLQW
jgi:hypothetical protein